MKKSAKIIQLFPVKKAQKFNPTTTMSDEYLMDRILDGKTPMAFKEAFAKELNRRAKHQPEIGHRA